MMPTISVVMYVKNGARTIEDAIKSVVSQGYPGCELIAIDGASTDGTWDIICRYASHFARTISEPDSGAFEAANKGIALATGEIVLLLMADDWLSPGALSEIAGAFAADPGCDLVSSGVKVVEETSDGKFTTVAELDGAANALTLENVLAVPYSGARFYRRRLLERLGVMSSEFPNGHDLELLLRCLAGGVTTRLIERPLYIYRRHAGSRTLVFNPHAYRRIYDENVRMAARYRNNAGLDEAARRTVADWGFEQYARWALLELRDRAPIAAVRVGLAGQLYRPAALAALWRRWRAILARRQFLAEHAARRRQQELASGQKARRAT
jgi:glycosyltransferase involved in cell wall biosynthesis